MKLAASVGIEIPDDIRFIFRDDLFRDDPDDIDANYGGFQTHQRVRWSDFYVNGKIPVRIRRRILESDEAIVAIIAHEMHELNELRRLFEERELIPGVELRQLIRQGVKGNLHDQAWDVADRHVRTMRGGMNQ